MTKIKKYRGKSRLYTKYGGTTEQVTVISKKDREREKELKELPARQGMPPVEVPPEIERGKYADGFGVSFKEGEFIIDFLKIEKQKIKLHTRVITSPTHIKRFAKTIEKMLRR
ncbi:MAG: DUF3467 domain-containing protein [Elusimicrobiota bacterium]